MLLHRKILETLIHLHTIDLFYTYFYLVVFCCMGYKYIVSHTIHFFSFFLSCYASSLQLKKALENPI